MAPNPLSPCILLAQGDRNKVGAVVLIDVENGKIKTINLCNIAPHPSSCRRLGEYSGEND